ncbi:hypothetical protein [Rhodanobacter sp. PCA2]|uniref:hypothetical protein n=1 Tax=Rhodanobacter sp. PCA2 TaxID=2006117 RepID=UPI0015E70BBB|nr:hypothetical protein [Rhodanobacter sp. PCA2]
MKSSSSKASKQQISGIDLYVKIYRGEPIERRRNFFLRLETVNTAAGITVLFFSAVLWMLFGSILVYCFPSEKYSVYDYFAYVSPCCAAILAGMTIYYDRYKGLLFIGSLILLYGGIISSLHGSDYCAAIAGRLLMMIMGGLCAVATFRSVQATIDLRAKSRNGLLGHPVSLGIWCREWLTPTLFILFTVYIEAWLRHNLHCIYLPQAQVVSTEECSRIWWHW